MKNLFTLYKIVAIPVAVVLAFITICLTHLASLCRFGVELLGVTRPGYSAGVGFPDVTGLRRDKHKFVKLEFGGFNDDRFSQEEVDSLTDELYPIINGFFDVDAGIIDGTVRRTEDIIDEASHFMPPADDQIPDSDEETHTESPSTDLPTIVPADQRVLSDEELAKPPVADQKPVLTLGN